MLLREARRISRRYNFLTFSHRCHASDGKAGLTLGLTDVPCLVDVPRCLACRYVILVEDVLVKGEDNPREVRESDAQRERESDAQRERERATPRERERERRPESPPVLLPRPVLET